SLRRNNFHGGDLSRRTSALAMIAATIGVLACSSSSVEPVKVPEKLGPGTWGSADMGLVVTDSSAIAHFGFCADGTLAIPIVLDPNGRFDVKGTYLRNIGPAIQAKSARYVGLWRRSSIIVTVMLSDPIGPNGSDVVGPFDLSPNASGPLPRPCPL